MHYSRPAKWFLIGAWMSFGLLSTTNLSSAADTLEYPKTRTVDHVDTYHGVKVPDPYRWLEEDVRTSPEVAAWVAEQSKLTEDYLNALPARDAIIKKLTKLWNYERFSSPFKKGGHYFFFKNDGLQNQSVVYIQDSLEAEPRILFDPNTWSKDGTIALSGFKPSEDGKYIAYCTSEAGSDWKKWHLYDLENNKELPDTIEWSKSGSVSWSKDHKGFFYERFPTPEEGKAFQSLNMNEKIYYHVIGNDQSEDTLVYERPDHPEWGFGCGVTDYGSETTEDGNYLIISVSIGTDHRNRLFVRDLSEKYGTTRDVIPDFDNSYSFLGNIGKDFYFMTDHKAPRRRIVKVNIHHPERENHVEIVPEVEETLEDANLVGNKLVCSYLKDACTQVKVFALDGTFERNVALPGIGTAIGFGGRYDDTETFYTFMSFATAPTIYKYDVATGESKEFHRSAVPCDLSQYVVEQVFFKSKDGTRVPMFITHKKGLKLDGSNPTLLYSYGGFTIPMTPSFSTSRLAWLEIGGVYAVPCIRGGGEYGEAWHKAGTKLQKQNVFDDFIAAAEWLIENKYTSTKKLAIEGGSNGGLLVGACMTQRPDLYGVCLPHVGVMDMLRFHKFTAGRYWTDDYGSSDSEAEFKALHAYSPYHNVENADYPPTMILTADTDDRVVPSHSFKFGAAMQTRQQGDAPILLRIETRAGHGAGTPTSKKIEEVADCLAFIAKHLGMDVGE